MKDQPAGTAVGIDLGTTNSVVAVWRSQGTVTIKDADASFTPSVVAFTERGERLVGDIARRQQPLNPRNTVYSVKQIIGRQYIDPVVANAQRHWPFKIMRNNSDGTCRILVSPAGRKSLLRPEAISAAVLSRLVTNAERKLNTKISGAVITVPASFSNQQRLATENAARIANLKVLKLMNEPSAAAYVYGTSLLDAAPVARHMLVFDLGGGTLDVAVLYVPASNSSVTEDDMRIKAVDADLTLGGDTFTSRLVQYALEELPAATGQDIAMFNKPRELSVLYNECEKVKKMLTECKSDFCNVALRNGQAVQLEVTRDRFEELCQPDFQRVNKPLDRVLEQAQLQRQDIDRVLLVGGSTRIPAIRAILHEYFGDRVELNHQVDPDEAVAHGAAIEAARLWGMMQPDGRGVIKPHRSISMDPMQEEQHKEMVKEFFARGTLGADSRAPHHRAQTLAGEAGRPPQAAPKIAANFDALPHTLSLVYGQGECWQMLKANRSYPAVERQQFPKAYKEQDSITISIVEGASKLAAENELVGRFEVSGLAALPSGIDVTFAVNASGIFEVTAHAVDDPSNRHHIEVKSTHEKLSDGDIVRLQEEELKQQVKRIMQQVEDQLQEVGISPNTVAHYKGVHEDAHKMVAGVHTLSSDGVNLLKYRVDKVPVIPDGYSIMW